MCEIDQEFGSEQYYSFYQEIAEIKEQQSYGSIEDVEMESESEQNDEQEGQWDIKVPISESVSKRQPFNKLLASNCATATELQYVGNRSEVCQQMQFLSHEARAFCVRQEGLKGFLEKDEPHFKHLSPRAKRVIR